MLAITIAKALEWNGGERWNDVGGVVHGVVEVREKLF